MKYILALATLAASALAQSVNIGAPADMTTVTPGNNITVQVNRPVCTSLSCLENTGSPQDRRTH